MNKSAMIGLLPEATDRTPARVALLREMSDLPLVRTLTQPGWHVLCDDAMGDVLHASGLPDRYMSRVLEHGEFLDAPLSDLSADNATLVIATRRSEQAVLGVLRRRKLRAVPLFAVLLTRLAAYAPGRLGPEAVRQSGPCARLSLRVVPEDTLPALVPTPPRMRDGVYEVAPFGRAQVALARAQADIGFDVRAWWAALVRAQPGVERIVLQVSAARTGMFLAALPPADAAFLRQELAAIALEPPLDEDGVTFLAHVRGGLLTGRRSDVPEYAARMQGMSN